ncbi:MAG TPA: alpha/beta fold hydrolase [Candidatus Limnocylindria bacterium]|nr:alpha/beta fold hydrolase [Candidatus Limnocylindria bacterium]
MTALTQNHARHTLTVDGCATSYLRGGTGPPLLFLHGSGGVAAWLPWMDRLAERYDVIIPDHPGWGRSEMPAWLDTIHDLAYFYLDFIEALGLAQVDLVGNSLGGWIACELAVRSTIALRRLVLVSPAGLRVPGVQKFDIFAHSHEDVTRRLFHDPALAERVLAQPVDEAALDLQLKNRFATARVAWQPRLYDPHLAKWLHRIDVPTLILWGEDDALLPAAYAAEFARLIPGARVATIPQCGHLPHVEKPAVFAQHVEAFLTRESA